VVVGFGRIEAWLLFAMSGKGAAPRFLLHFIPTSSHLYPVFIQKAYVPCSAPSLDILHLQHAPQFLLRSLARSDGAHAASRAASPCALSNRVEFSTSNG
jgi:hypothetical protein